ncbi:phage tail tape measure protein [Lactiplantibacillus nangangensis]|uniref:Phage tail tape measure protein n=1 Tax=Lactiplantibacillus nangangensis TaxID=2559917 RepID=A0ABW1SLK2_9LACO|nr:phage tail tape measure protein [Lactiplantibacillus nangangensis]
MGQIKKVTIGLKFQADQSGLKAAESSVERLSVKAAKVDIGTKGTTSLKSMGSAASQAGVQTENLSGTVKRNTATMAVNSRAAKEVAANQAKHAEASHKTAAEMKALKEDVDRYNTKLKSQREALESSTKADQAYTSMLKAQGHAHAANSDHIKSLRNTYSKLQTQYKEEVTQLDRIKRSSGTVSAEYQKQRKIVNDLGLKTVETADKTSRLTRAQGSLKSAASGFNSVYDKTKGVSLAVGAAFVYGAKKAIELQHAYKVTNNLINTGGESVRQSFKATKEMQADGEKYSVKYGTSQKEIATNYQELVKRGYNSSQALGSMNSMMKASVASGDSLSDVVHDSTSAIEAFGLRANSTSGMIKNTKMATNQMAYAADLTATDFHSMGVAMTYAGATAHQSKLSLSETASTIGILSNNGLEADKAGTSLRKMLSSLQAPSKSAKDAMSKLGLSTSDFVKKNGDMKSMADIFGLIQKHSAKLGAAQKGAVFHNLFGATGQAAGAILADNAGQLGKLNKQVENAGKKDYTGKLSGKNMQSAQNQLKKFKMEWEELSVTFARTVLPQVTSLAKAGTSLLEKFSGLSKTQKSVATWSVVAVAAIAPIAKGISGMMTATSAAIGVWKKLRVTMAQPMPVTGTSTATSAAENVAAEASTVSGTGEMLAGGTKLSRLASKALPAAKVAGKGALGISALMALPELLSMTKKTVGKHIGSYVGNVGGSAGGAAAGAAIGSIIPGAGTAVGGLIGGGLALGGSYLGSKYGSKAGSGVGEWLQKNGPKLWKSVNVTVDPSGKNSKSNQTSSSKSGNSSKHSVSAARKEFDSLPKDAQKATKSATGYIKAANSDWTKSEGLWHAGSVKSRAESNRMQAKSDASYDKAYAALAKYTNKSNTSTSKSASYLTKLGLINQNQASNAVTVEQRGSSKRLTDIRNTMTKLKTAEHNGGSDRFRLQQQLNGQILRLTDKGGKKREALLSKLNSQTSRLSSKQYKSITSQARSAANSTVKSANKQYKTAKDKAQAQYYATKTAADKTYNKTAKAAANVYGKNSSMYNQIMDKAGKTRDDTIGKAEDQRDKSVAAAKDQHDKTVSWARKQRDEVEKEAQKQAGNVYAIMGGVGDAIYNVLSQNAAAVGGKLSKPKSDDQALSDYYNVKLKTTKSKKNVKSLSVNTGIHHSSKKSNLHLQTGMATGGAIRQPQTAMVGERGIEVLQRGRKFSIIGQRGAQLMGLKPGDQIYNNADTQRMLSGSYGKRIKGFADGTTTIGSYTVGEAGSSTTSKSMEKAVQKDYKKMATDAKSSLGKIQFQNKKSWQSASLDTFSSTDMIRKTAGKNSDKTKVSYSGNIKQLRKQNGQLWDNMTSDSKQSGIKIAKTADAKSNDAKNYVVSNWKSLSKQFGSISDDMVSGFNTAFKKLGPYAAKAMESAVSNLNHGISAVDTTLAQFGGNKAVLKPIHYAQGSKGPIASDRMAVLNDAKAGPKQELVVRGNSLLKPHGKDVLTPLQKGDEVLNGSQVERIKPMLPHFAKGTGVSNDRLIDLAQKNSGNPSKTWKSDFDNHVGKAGRTNLAKGVTKTTKRAADSVGPKWSGAMWGLINNTIQGDTGNGSLKPHFGSPFNESSGYGPRSGDVTDNHKGIDFSAPMGTPIPAQYAGTVVTAGAASGFGNWVVIRPNGMNMNTVYGHMKSYSVHAGDKVKAGQIIARVGAEGEATGPHVHYELRQGLGSGDNRPNPDTYKGNVKTVKKPGNKALNSLVKRQLGSKAIRWIEDNLQDNISSIALSGSEATRAQALAKAIRHMYPSATKAGIAAALGNWKFESGLNPGAINSGGGASGLGQWLGGRKSNLIAYATSHGKNWKQAGAQLAFALSGDGSDSSVLKSVLRGTGSVASLAAKFSSQWERGGYTAQHVAGARSVASMLKFAKGGRPMPGKWALVGEEGPELFKTDEPGTVVPHEQTKQLLNGNASTQSESKVKPQSRIDFHPTININVSGGASVDKEQVKKWVLEAMGESFDQLKDIF